MLTSVFVLSLILFLIEALDGVGLRNHISFSWNISESEHPKRVNFTQPPFPSNIERTPFKETFVSPPYYPTRSYYLFIQDYVS